MDGVLHKSSRRGERTREQIVSRDFLTRRGRDERGGHRHRARLGQELDSVCTYGPFLCYCAGPRIHYGKTRICRVFFIGHMAKNPLIVCTHGKAMLWRVHFFWHTAKPCSAVCFFLTHGKYMLCRVFYLGTRQSKKILFSPRNFLYSLHTTYDTPC